MFGLRISVFSPIILILLPCVFHNPVSAGEYCKVLSSGLKSNVDVKFTMMISMRKNYEQQCKAISGESLQQYVAVKWALEKINSENASFIPGVRIGFQMYDDCRSETFAARNALDLLNPFLPSKITDCISDNSTSQLNIGVIGPTRSSTVTVTGNLLKMTGIPIITQSATLSSLSNKTLYPNILRTAVPDTYQVEAIVQILKELEWSYVAVVYTSDSYGQQGMATLQKRTKEENICVAQALLIKPTITFSDIVDELKRISFSSQDHTLAVVYFGQKDVAENLLFYANTVKDTNNFHWIMSDAVGQNVDVFSGKKETLVAGVLTISPSSTQLPEFSAFYSKLLTDVSKNVVTDSLISEYLQTAGNNIPESSFKHNDYVSLTLDAVYALVMSFKKAHNKTCNSKSEVCDQLKTNVENGDLLKYVKDIVVNYTNLDSINVPAKFQTEKRSFTFSETGDIIRGSSMATYVINSFDFSTESFDTVGSFYGDSIQLDKSRIKMKASNGAVVTGNDLPKSACSATCNSCIDDTKTPMVYIPGDVYIVGIFSLHNSDPDGRFGCAGFRNVSSDTILLEGFLQAIEVAKATTGINFGAIAFDDCYNPLKMSTTLSIYFSGIQVTSEMFSYQVPWKKVACVIGALSSGVTIPIAEFFSQLNIPVVSYAASTNDLDDKTNFPYFLRTVPSDDEQAGAMVAIVEQMGWEYVDLLFVGNNYGTKGKDAFVKMAASKGICVGEPLKINEINSDDAELYKTIIELQRRQAKVVIFFGIDTRYSDLMKVLNNRQHYGEFIFLASEEWGTKKQLLLDGGRAARGTITLNLASPQVEDEAFVKYMLTRSLDNAHNNPWFKEFWQHLFKCNIRGSFKNVFITECPDKLMLTEEILAGHLRDERVAHVRSAVIAVTEGLKKTKGGICSDGSFPCNFYYESKYSPRIIENIRSVELRAKASDTYFRLFDNSGNGAIGFKIYNIQHDGKELYKQVGYYNNGVLTLHQDKLKFYNELGDEITTVASTCEDRRCDTCSRILQTSPQPTSKPQTSTDMDVRFRIPDIILIVLVGVVILFLIIVIAITCCYFRRKIEVLSKHVQAVENQHMYEPIRDGVAYQNRQFDRARFHPEQETIKFVNPSLNSLGSVTNIGVNNQGFIHDDNYLHTNGSILSNISPQDGVGVLPSPHKVIHPGQRISNLSTPHQSLPRPTSSTISSPLSHFYGDQMFMGDPINHGSLIGNGHVPTSYQHRGFQLPIQVPYTPSSTMQQSPDERVEYSDVVTPPEPSEQLHMSPQHLHQNNPTLESPSHSVHSQTSGTPYQMSPTDESIHSNSMSSLGQHSHSTISPTDIDPQAILRQRTADRITKPPRQNKPPSLPQKIPSQLSALNRNSHENIPMNDVNSPMLSRRQTGSPSIGNSPQHQGVSIISSGIPSYPQEQRNITDVQGINLDSPQYSENNTPDEQGGFTTRISRV